MTLKQLLAAGTVPAAPAEAETGDHPLGPDAPKPLMPPVFAPPRQGFLVRQDGTEPLPDEWPPNEASYATGADLVIVQNPDGDSFIAIRRPNLPLIYLLGPIPTVIFPF